MRTRPYRRLRAARAKDLLRFITCGSVDDGKSTLIGRLLYEVEALVRRPAGRSSSATAAVAAPGPEGIDFALLVDGLEAEREQGITIDVAYRFFATDDAPLHRRRHAGARAVHAQHGHRRVDAPIWP